MKKGPPEMLFNYTKKKEINFHELFRSHHRSTKWIVSTIRVKRPVIIHQIDFFPHKIFSPRHFSHGTVSEFPCTTTYELPSRRCSPRTKP